MDRATVFIFMKDTPPFKGAVGNVFILSVL